MVHWLILVCFRTSYALGPTVPELGLATLSKELNPLGSPQPKTLFSMMIPEVAEAMKKKEIASVVIFGIEVRVVGIVRLRKRSLL